MEAFCQVDTCSRAATHEQDLGFPRFSAVFSDSAVTFLNVTATVSMCDECQVMMDSLAGVQELEEELGRETWDLADRVNALYDAAKPTGADA